MKTISEAVQLTSKYFQDKGIERATRLAEDLFGFVLKLKRLDLYLQFDRPLNEEELVPIRQLVARCAKNEPFEYVTGEVDFFGCQLLVDKRVLIPRQETEILASLISGSIQNEEILWDICTGSGCLGLSLKKKHPKLKVILSDLSEDALNVARINAKKNFLDIEFRCGDLFAPFELTESADLIVCNPPYVKEDEWKFLCPSVKDFEPKMALVALKEGLAFYEQIANIAPMHLKSKGKLWLEIGSAQKEGVKKIFSDGASAKYWAKIEPIQDWSGKDRFFFLEKG